MDRQLALLARADQGGIGAQSWLFARAMLPERILVCHTEHTSRGIPRPEIYEPFCNELRTCRRAPGTADAIWLTQGMASVFTVECFYGTAIPIEAKRRGVQSVIQGNPEMSADEMCDVMLAPTGWRTDALFGQNHPPPFVLPFPHPIDLMPRRVLSGEVRTIYTVASNAMEDRNGIELLMKACEYVRSDVLIRCRGGAWPHVQQIGRVQWAWLGHYDGMFYKHWPENVDLFVMPRRYGGLSLPMQEAAALGLPILTTRIPPQSDWFIHESHFVPASLDHQAAMRGGHFDVHTCRPEELAAKIDAIATDGAKALDMGEATYRWALDNGWDRWRPAYEEILRDRVSPSAVEVGRPAT